MKYELQNFLVCRRNSDRPSRSAVFRIVDDHKRYVALRRRHAVSEDRIGLREVYADQSLGSLTVVGGIEGGIHKERSFRMVRTRLTTDDINAMHVEEVLILSKRLVIKKPRHQRLHI